ncbi:MAG TPA: HNH endonuclease family protein [Tepidisphaeraceae bacterium]|nr:HNH endonuclease family protein [Tepidisphaeraceae bacterium]
MSDYLTLQTGQEVVAATLFSSFREFIRDQNGQTADVHMRQFRSYADVFQGFSSWPADSREGQFIYRLEQLDTTTVYPLLLEIFNLYGDAAGKAQRRQIIEDLESLFVRRAVCELTTKNYNRLFVDMIRSLRSNDDFSAAAVRKFLLEQTAETTIWPDDETFTAAWMTINFYRRLKKSKARMILEAIELALFNSKTEKVQIEQNLTIEHLMPKEWVKHWPLSESAATDEAKEKASNLRDELLHKVGNLTLLTKRLNPSISNGPWSKKREKILEHSALNMNRAFHTTTTWDEGAIFKRSEELLKIGLKLWPVPARTNAG